MDQIYVLVIFLIAYVVWSTRNTAANTRADEAFFDAMVLAAERVLGPRGFELTNKDLSGMGRLAEFRDSTVVVHVVYDGRDRDFIISNYSADTPPHERKFSTKVNVPPPADSSPEATREALVFVEKTLAEL
jgi:hypothetical protein